MRLLRTCAVAIVICCAALGASVPSALASIGPTHTYRLVILPARVAAGSSTTLNFALTNTSVGAQLGSADFRAPAGFKVTSASLPPGSAGTATVSANLVALRNLALAPGATVNVSVTATAPDLCGFAIDLWGSEAKVDPNFTGTPLLLGLFSSPITLVTSDCSLQFLTEPANAVVGQDITGTDFTPSGPPVSVEIVDGAGNPVTLPAPITISVANNPGGAKLGGTTTVTAKGGVATFSDLTLDEPANGYTLNASAKGLKGTTSTRFDEASTATQCPQNKTCQTDLSSPTSNLAITAIAASSGPNAGTLSESLDIGPALECPGYTPQDSHWFGFFLTGPNRRKEITYTVTPTGQSKELVGSTQICFGASVDFTTQSGKPAPPITLPDGSIEFEGLLPDCPAAGGPCVESRGTTPDPNSPTGYDLVLNAEAPAAFAGDPRMRA
jgi:hypothetical protein